MGRRNCNYPRELRSQSTPKNPIPGPGSGLDTKPSEATGVTLLSHAARFSRSRLVWDWDFLSNHVFCIFVGAHVFFLNFGFFLNVSKFHLKKRTTVLLVATSLGATAPPSPPAGSSHIRRMGPMGLWLDGITQDHSPPFSDFPTSGFVV